MRIQRTLFACFLSLILVIAACLAVRADVFLPPPFRISLPLEVMGADGTTASVPLFLPRTAATLTLQVHGLENAQEASVRVGYGPWVPLTNTTCTVAEPGKSYGGIGGGYATLSLALPVRANAGLCRVWFRFNHTDGVNSGFRVLTFNFLDGRGRALLPASTFSQHDPGTETPPLTDAASQAGGKSLWHSAPLVEHPGGPAITAGCGSCHSQDGRDLKYYGYTNNSIYQRCLFHGLTRLQAQQITSYVRTLPVPVLGRPWNPPYQPGPGMDSKPLSAWAAGAGLNAVLGSDAAMLSHLFPNGITKDGIGAQDTLNMRELPLALQLPDWNHWLPRIHPKDAWGDTFTNSYFAKFYDQPDGPGRAGGNNLRAILSNPDAGYHAYITTQANSPLPSLLNSWSGIDYGDFIAHRQAENDGTAAYQEKMVGTEHWMLVKTWEIMQEYNLEGNAPLIFPTPKGAPVAGESRSWLSETVFLASPAFIGVREDGSLYPRPEFEYLTNAWYSAQMVMNAGNRHRQGWHPVDWGYAVGRTGDLFQAAGVPSKMRMTAMLIKGMQQSDTNGTVDTTYGWFPHFAGDMRFFYWHRDIPEPGLDDAPWARVATATTGAWFDEMQRFTPAQYQNSSQGGEGSVVYGGDSLFNMDKEMLPSLAAVGVDKALLVQIADWNKTVWPTFNWDSLKP